jgi:hypothetical protein
VRQRFGLLGILMICAFGTPAAAQLPEIGVPGGSVRIEVGAEFASIDRQLQDGQSEPWRSEFAVSSIGGAYFPDLLPAEATIAGLAGLPNYSYNIGRATMAAQASRGTLRLGLSLGITDRLTLFGSLPLVQQRVQVAYRFDPAAADAGFNPADPLFGTPTGAAATTQFLSSFGSALDTLQSRLDAGFYDGDPGQKAIAQATLTEGSGQLSGLDALLADPATQAPFVPTELSPAGSAISTRVAGTQASLAALGITTFTEAVPLPTATLTQEDYELFLTASGGRVGARPFATSSSFLAGDAEVGAAYTVLDAWDQDGAQGGIRLVVQALARLPTGSVVAENDFVSLPSGDHQLDVEGSVVADIGRGRVGARLTGSYTNQMAAEFDRRVTRPTQPVPWANRRALVEVDPGNVFGFRAEPFFRIGDAFAIVGVFSYASRGSDEVTYVSDAIAGVSASELAEGTDVTATTLGAGLSFAPARRDGRASIDGFWMFEKVVSASGGRVPETGAIRMGIRVPVQLWGEESP